MKIARLSKIHVPPPRSNKHDAFGPAITAKLVQDPRRYKRMTRIRAYRPSRIFKALTSPALLKHNSPRRERNNPTSPKSVTDKGRIAKGYEKCDSICLINGFREDGMPLITSDVVESDLTKEIDPFERQEAEERYRRECEEPWSDKVDRLMADIAKWQADYLRSQPPLSDACYASWQGRPSPRSKWAKRYYRAESRSRRWKPYAMDFNIKQVVNNLREWVKQRKVAKVLKPYCRRRKPYLTRAEAARYGKLHRPVVEEPVFDFNTLPNEDLSLTAPPQVSTYAYVDGWAPLQVDDPMVGLDTLPDEDVQMSVPPHFSTYPAAVESNQSLMDVDVPMCGHESLAPSPTYPSFVASASLQMDDNMVIDPASSFSSCPSMTNSSSSEVEDVPMTPVESEVPMHIPRSLEDGFDNWLRGVKSQATTEPYQPPQPCFSRVEDNTLQQPVFNEQVYHTAAPSAANDSADAFFPDYEDEVLQQPVFHEEVDQTASSPAAGDNAEAFFSRFGAEIVEKAASNEEVDQTAPSPAIDDGAELPSIADVHYTLRPFVQEAIEHDSNALEQHDQEYLDLQSDSWVDDFKGKVLTSLTEYPLYPWRYELQATPSFLCAKKGAAIAGLGQIQRDATRQRYVNLWTHHPDVWEALLGTMLQEGVTPQNLLLAHDDPDEVLDDEQWCIDLSRFDEIQYCQRAGRSLPADISSEFHEAPEAQNKARMYHDEIRFLKTSSLEVQKAFRLVVSVWLGKSKGGGERYETFRNIVRKAGWVPANEDRVHFLTNFIVQTFDDDDDSELAPFRPQINDWLIERCPRFFTDTVVEQNISYDTNDLL